MKSLTKRQQEVLELDQQGLRPSEIAERLGLRLSRVANLKQRLKEMGYSTTQYRRSDLPKAVTVQLPTDDEEAVIERCQCGLMLPCYHGNDAISLTGSSAGTAADAGDVSEYDTSWSPNRAENRGRKMQEPTGTDSSGQRPEKARQRVDGTVHVS